jgi:hypothetical protein
MGDMKNAYKILYGKREGMRAFRNPRLRWVDDVRIGPKPIGYEGVE